MKRFFLFFSLAILFAGCKEEKPQIELIPNLEAEYLSEEEVDKSLGFADSNYDIRKDLVEAVKSIDENKTDDTLSYIIALRVYIDEKGKVRKLKDISSYYDRLEVSSDGRKNFTDRDKLNNALLKKIEYWRFNPSEKDGKRVKVYADLKDLSVISLPGGKYEVKLPNFMSGIFGSQEEYLTNADEMPMPLGGLEALAKNVIYPEQAKREGIEGKVFVKALIDEQGNVVKTEIIKGVNPLLDNAARDAVMKIKFTPGKVKGKPVKTQVTVPIFFKLK
ncbi:MAG: energy transducer TonB [Ignavibacteriaceae bacterium]|nr:energy transducer TonB [Ignavibacteriaceae bacterium]